MRGRSAHRLAAEMGGGHSPTFVCEPFKTATVHLFHCSQARGYPVIYDIGSCDPSDTIPPWPQAKKINPIYPYILSTIGNSKRGEVYGQTGENIINHHNPTKVLHLNGVYFNSSDLDAWKFRRSQPNFMPPMLNDPDAHPSEIVEPYDPPAYVTGPGIANPHAFYPVKRRTACDPQYNNYLDWCFTDEGVSHMLDDYDQPICPVDRLGHSYPAKYIWHNADIEQPFTGGVYWEDNGTQPINVATPEGRGLIPFCTPINAYSSEGVLLGQYVGYSHIFFFNNNFYVGGNDQGKKTAEDPGNLPADFTSPAAIKPPVARYKDAHSMDVHVYMVASPLPGKTLKSPRIGSKRFWRPNNIAGYTWAPLGFGIGVPHLYFLGGTIDDDWGIRLRLNTLGGGWVERVMGMGNFSAYLVP